MILMIVVGAMSREVVLSVWFRGSDAPPNVPSTCSLCDHRCDNNSRHGVQHDIGPVGQSPHRSHFR
jgi:hypothetical protein